MSENESHFEPAPDLDPLIREAARSLSRQVDRPDEEVVLAYLSGTADSGQIHAVREALTRMPAFRRELVEFGEELERLQDPELEKAFDSGLIDSRSAARRAAREQFSQEAPAPTRERVGHGSWLGRLFARPAFAAAMLLLILAYPAWQILRGPGDTPLVLEPGTMPGQSVTFFLRFDRNITLRGDDDPIPVRTLAVTTSEAAVDLRLQAPPGAREGDRFHLSLQHEAGLLWQSRTPLAVVEVDEELVIPLALDPHQLPAGPVIIAAESAGVPAGSDVEPTRYRFRVEPVASGK